MAKEILNSQRCAQQVLAGKVHNAYFSIVTIKHNQGNTFTLLRMTEELLCAELEVEVQTLKLKKVERFVF